MRCRGGGERERGDKIILYRVRRYYEGVELLLFFELVTASEKAPPGCHSRQGLRRTSTCFYHLPCHPATNSVGSVKGGCLLPAVYPTLFFLALNREELDGCGSWKLKRCSILSAWPSPRLEWERRIQPPRQALEPANKHPGPQSILPIVAIRRKKYFERNTINHRPSLKHCEYAMIRGFGFLLIS